MGEIDAYRGDWGDQRRDVLSACDGNESPIDLDWAEFENYGAYSEVAQYLQNN